MRGRDIIKISFRLKILLIMITSILIPVVILSNYLTDNSERYYSEFISTGIKDQVNTDVLRIENFFSNSKSELEMYSNILELNDDEGYISTLLNQLRDINPIFVNVYFTNNEGDNYLDSFKKPVVDGRERDWYKEAISENKFIISDPYIDKLTNAWVISLSTPVRRDDGLYGVLGVDILISEIVSSIASKTLTNGKYVVVNHLNEIIFRDNEISNNDEALDIIFNNNSNDSIVVDKYVMKNLKMSIYIAYSKENYFSSMKSIGIQMAVVFLFTVSITVIFTFTGAKKMSEPLNDFKDKIKILNSDFEADISEYEIFRWDQEFYEIFSKFNEFSKSIRLDREKLAIKIEVLYNQNNKLVEKNIILEEMYKDSKIIDRRIRKSQKKYDSILNNVRDIIWVLDRDGNISFVNSILEESLDYTLAELIGKSIGEIVKSNYSDISSVLDIITKRDFKKIDIEMIKKNGEIFNVEANTTRIYDDNNSIMNIYCVCKDISKAKALHYNYNIKIQEQNFIMDLTETASMNVSLSKVTEVIFDKFNSIFGWSVGTIRLLNEDNEFELISRTKILSSYISDRTLKYEDSCLSYVVNSKEIKYINTIDDLPIKEEIYCKIIEEGYSIIFIPVGSEEIGKGVISLTIDKKSMVGKEDMLRSFISTILIVVERAIIYEKLKMDYIKMIKVLAEAGDDKDSSSVGHSNRVAKYSKKIAESMYLDNDEIIDIEICGLLHDIGKIGISDDLLSVSGKLKLNSKEEIKKHTTIGRKMLEGIGLSESILDGIEFHHKNLDLTGYPEHLHLETLPLFSKIIQVSDSFDNRKTEEKCKSDIEVWEEMNMSTGSEFCPQVMRIFKDIIKKDIN